MRALRLLVCEGNTRRHRERVAATTGATTAQAYARTLQTLETGAAIDIVCPADEDADPVAPIESYDGVAITGSALNIHRAEPESLRQIDFARSVFAAGVPFFGSCWGLQVATVAAGGEVAQNPRGREVVFARKLILTESGRGHPMHEGRDLAFDAPAIHVDIVTSLPADAVVTVRNAISDIQAAEIRSGQGVFWGVQYHPEYTLRDLAATVLRYGQRLVDERFFRDVAALAAYAEDLATLDADRSRVDIAWRLGIGGEILEPERRLTEIANWLRHQVRPAASRRLRG